MTSANHIIQSKYFVILTSICANHITLLFCSKVVKSNLNRINIILWELKAQDYFVLVMY